MITLGFGRFNIPHPGHIHYINHCDMFVLSKGQAKNKLPTNVRYNALVLIYPHVSSKIIVGNIKDVFKQFKDATILCTKENINFPQAFGMKTKVLEKHMGLSSTTIRGMIDNKDWVGLRKIYPSKLMLKTIILLRNIEICQELTEKHQKDVLDIHEHSQKEE